MKKKKKKKKRRRRRRRRRHKSLNSNKKLNIYNIYLIEFLCSLYMYIRIAKS